MRHDVRRGTPDQYRDYDNQRQVEPEQCVPSVASDVDR
jgi:hypothetical protein